MPIQTINPYTNMAVKSFEEMTEQAVQAKVAKAQLAFTDWKETSYQQRATLLTDLKPGIAAYHEELFGPVASFYVVKDEQAAIALANDSDFGLGGSVFTGDIGRGKKIADQIDTGMVFINHPTWTQADLPFGGTKHSGFGRELSALGINEFVNKKLIRTSDLNDPF